MIRVSNIADVEEKFNDGQVLKAKQNQLLSPCRGSGSPAGYPARTVGTDGNLEFSVEEHGSPGNTSALFRITARTDWQVPAAWK
jgi:hypothetical protein